MAGLDPRLRIHPEVASALREGRAVVALESTIVSHGMPYPQNVETARAVEGDRLSSLFFKMYPYSPGILSFARSNLTLSHHVHSDIIREEGAIPATIAIFDGTLCVGLQKEQLERLGREVWILV